MYLGAIIVSQIRILSDCLMEAFALDQRMQILGYCSTAAQALDMIMGEKPDFVLLDAAFSDAKPIVVHILAISPASGWSHWPSTNRGRRRRLGQSRRMRLRAEHHAAL